MRSRMASSSREASLASSLRNRLGSSNLARGALEQRPTPATARARKSACRSHSRASRAW